ncbi:MAG: heavy metal translocating P-type ATPase metal-binding domain-containing protein [Bacteroidetes bacterium]|nr:heavy metal translocating P-type ATPase metal-binding domain-containing protein [Bacteroidota bacterium]
MQKNTIFTETQCYHCGENCNEEVVHLSEKSFCCTGCKLVYELLLENDLCNYYNLQTAPGKHKHFLGIVTLILTKLLYPKN